MILPFIYSSLDECVALPLRLIAVSHAQSGEIRPLPRPPASPMYVFGFKLPTLTDVSESTMCTKRPNPARGWASSPAARAQLLPKHIYYAAKSGAVWGAYVYVGSLFLQARGGIFMTHRSRTAYGDQWGVRWNHFLAKINHTKRSLHSKLTPRAEITFCGHFDPSWAFSSAIRQPGSEMRLSHPVLKMGCIIYHASLPRQGLLQSLGMRALLSPSVGFGARPFFQWQEKNFCHKLGAQSLE